MEAFIEKKHLFARGLKLIGDKYSDYFKDKATIGEHYNFLDRTDKKPDLVKVFDVPENINKEVSTLYSEIFGQ